jgi:RimJ/RimL family protein N-acetyltransferase
MAARTTLAEAFPLFALRLRSERLELRLPTDDELLRLMDVARSGIHPPDEMPFGVAWSTQPSPAFERGYLAYHWANRSGWSAEDWELGLAVWLDGRPIGMQGMHARRFSVLRTIGTGSWLARDVQGLGYGKEMRSAMLTLAFDGLGALVAETEAFTDNAASAGVSRALGYAENGMGGLAPEGVLRETQRFRMTVERWRSRSRPPVEIDGLDACREMFGA